MRNLFLLAGLLAGVAPALANAEGPARYLGTWVWSNDDPNFGGLSAIDVIPDGSGFVVLSDRARIGTGTFLRENGLVTGVEGGDLVPLDDGRGQPLTGPIADSEGLALAADGSVYVAFEGPDPRIRAEIGPDGIPVALPRNRDFLQYGANSSLEALAIDAGGSFYLIPERSGRYDRPFPVYRLRDGIWDIAFTIPRTDTLLVSGADIGPDGKLYVLERDWLGIGFRSRVRRFGMDGSGGETLLATGPLVHDNLEGIAVWHDGTSLRLTMVSDDNFSPIQRTEIVEYAVSD